MRTYRVPREFRVKAYCRERFNLKEIAKISKTLFDLKNDREK